MQDPEPEIEATPRKSMWGPTTGMACMCLIALAAQGVGLTAVVTYVTSREGWEAQKAQYSAVSSEWDSMSEATQTKIEELKNQTLAAEQARVAAETELDLVRKTLATAEGEYESMKSAADSILALQQRAQAKEQNAQDRLQNLNDTLDSLSEDKNKLELEIESSNQKLAAAQARMVTNKSGLESQNRQIADLKEQIIEMDTALADATTRLRKSNSDLVNASKGLAETLEEKKKAEGAVMSAVALEESVATLKSNKAQLTGEIEALNAVKTDAEAKLTAADSRLKVANVKLADFLDRWNNRDKLSADIDALNERVKELKQAEGMTLGNITTLNEQFADLTEKVSTITGSKKNLEANVKALKQTEKELLTSINELQNIRDAASTTDNSEAKSSDDNANPETGEADPKDEEETNE